MLKAAPDTLALTAVAGTARQCGAAYGERLAWLMQGFGDQLLPPTPRHLAYAQRCWRVIAREAPRSAAFLRGLAAGSRLALPRVTLNVLHEEIAHRERTATDHCTALAATGAATRDGRALVAQNWNWSPALYPWPGLLRLAIRDAPRVVSYHYPALWTCCGLNAAGLALMWTSVGLRPMVRPRIGLPTYVVIAELLALRTVDEAVQHLRRLTYAGCFMFLLGDAGGAIAVIEALPGRLAVDRGATTLMRENAYHLPALIAASRQAPPDARHHNVRHIRALRRLVRRAGALDARAARTILTHPTIFSPRLTLDSFVAVCRERALWTRRGAHPQAPWQTLTV